MLINEQVLIAFTFIHVPVFFIIIIFRSILEEYKSIAISPQKWNFKKLKTGAEEDLKVLQFLGYPWIIKPKFRPFDRNELHKNRFFFW